jgi:uncharacterized RDD family membrane protein YckC
MAPNNFSSGDQTTFGGETTETVPLVRSEIISPLRSGLRLERYRLIRFLGKGGFGEVWEAEDLSAGRHIALKVLTHIRASSPELLANFRREGQLAASLNHPRSVYVFGAEEVDGHPAIAMELMPGGTLSDQIHLRGRLPSKQAVDYILDVIEGLEAAQDAGVVHRDVKPSNCFVDGEGRVKIGDFGIAKTLEKRQNLTLADDDAFVGTPAFASPEQIRGRDVDYRSDIYSVGATLYCLLAGKHPFQGRNAGELLARILSEEPLPLPEQAGIPRRIDRIIKRCMAKEREKRYLNYAALRADLLPFSSRYKLTVAGPAHRLTAFAIDEICVALTVSTAVHAAFSGLVAEALYFVMHFLYYLSSEALWSRSFGKYLMGLRVGTAAGAAIHFKQVLLRTAALFAIFLPVLVLQFAAGLSPALVVAACLVCVATMRRDNGFAGPHELLSGTRVVIDSAWADGPYFAQSTEEPIGALAESQPAAFGPYHVIRDLWRDGGEALVLCFDRALRRNTWVHVSGGVAPAMPERTGLITEIRPARLRWLQSGALEQLSWDAFEAPPGQSLCELVALRGRLSWTEVREVLLGLAAEIERRLPECGGTLSLSLRHVWIDPAGFPRLLDFPAFANDAGGMAGDTHDAQSAKQFMHQVLKFGLTGEAVPAEDLGTAPPAAPLPEHARIFAGRLCRSGVSPSSIREIHSELRRMALRPPEVRWSARAAMIAAIAAVPVLALAFYAFAPVVRTMQLPLWQQEFERVPDYDALMKRLEAYGNIPDTRVNKEATCKLLSWIRGEAGRQPRGAVLLTRMRVFQRERLEDCRRKYPDVTQAEAMEARKTMDLCKCVVQTPPEESSGIWNAVELRVAELNLPSSMVRLGRGVTLIFWAAGLVWVVPVAMALLWPPGAAPHAFGLVVQTATGKPATRLRSAARSFIAWSPFAMFFPVLLLIGFSGLAPNATRHWETQGVLTSILLLQGYAPVLLRVEVALAAALIAGAIYAVIRPSKGIPDLLARTWLMPR